MEDICIDLSLWCADYDCCAILSTPNLYIISSEYICPYLVTYPELISVFVQKKWILNKHLCFWEILGHTTKLHPRTPQSATNSRCKHFLQNTIIRRRSLSTLHSNTSLINRYIDRCYMSWQLSPFADQIFFLMYITFFGFLRTPVMILCIMRLRRCGHLYCRTLLCKTVIGLNDVTLSDNIIIIPALFAPFQRN